MKYTALALLAAATFGASAAEPVTVYGKINLAMQSSEVGSTTSTSLKSHYSRLGFKGEQALTDDLTAVYKYEVKVKMDDEDGTFGKRNQYVGIKSKAYGEFLLGRKDTAMKSSQGKIDMFGDIDGDITTVFVGENRVGEAFHYTSPALMDGMLKVAGTWVFEGSNDQVKSGADHGFSLAANYGSTKFEDGKFYASVAYDYEVKGVNALRAAGYTQFGDIRLGGMVQMQEEAEGSDDGMAYMLNAAYLMGPVTYKAQFQSSDATIMAADGKAQAKEGDVLSVGMDYSLGKSTTLYGVYTDASLEVASDETHIGVGIIQLF